MFLSQVLPSLRPTSDDHDYASTATATACDSSSLLTNLVSESLRCTAIELLQLPVEGEAELVKFHVSSSNGQFVHVHKTRKHWTVNCQSKFCQIRNKVSQFVSLVDATSLCPHLTVLKDSGWASEIVSTVIDSGVSAEEEEEMVEEEASSTEEVLNAVPLESKL